MFVDLLGGAAAVHAASFASIGERAKAARSETRLEALQREFHGALEPLRHETRPMDLANGANALGALVARARDLDGSLALFDALRGDAGTLQDAATALRGRLEERAGDDDNALEALYRSEDWQRLDYSLVLLNYWGGWVELGRGEQLSSERERKAAMERAVAAFSRSALEIRLPGVATSSLLGLAKARRELGELTEAQRTLETLLQQLQRRPDPGLDTAARYELATLALARGDLGRAQQIIEGLPAGALSRQDRLNLSLQEAQGQLRLAGRGGDPARAAALLRELLAAGDPFASQAAALVEKYRRALAGQDLGSLGALLEAERAFEVGRYEEAKTGYAAVLEGGARVPGLRRANVTYKYAFALAETGDLETAASQLEALLADRDAGDVGALAAPLYYSVAERLAASDPGPAAQARASRAAERLLELAPGAPGADSARYRAARTREARGREKSSLAALERIGPESAAYPAARLDIARLHAGRFQALENQGASGSLPDLAKRLERDLATVAELIGQGRLDPDPSRDATFAVLRAKAAYWAGGSYQSVEARIAEARKARPDAAGQRSLLRLELRNRIRARAWPALAAMLQGSSDAELSDNFSIWHEALLGVERRQGPSDLRLAFYRRLEPLAPEKSRDTLALGHARALLDAGQAEAAAVRARALTERDSKWADAWILYAEALDAREDWEASFGAWSRVAGGLEAGTEPWVEAKLRAAEAARRLDDLARACKALRDLTAQAVGDQRRRRFDAASQGCAEASG